MMLLCLAESLSPCVRMPLLPLGCMFSWWLAQLCWRETLLLQFNFLTSAIKLLWKHHMTINLLCWFCGFLLVMRRCLWNLIHSAHHAINYPVIYVCLGVCGYQTLSFLQYICSVFDGSKRFDAKVVSSTCMHSPLQHLSDTGSANKVLLRWIADHREERQSSSKLHPVLGIARGRPHLRSRSLPWTMPRWRESASGFFISGMLASPWSSSSCSALLTPGGGWRWIWTGSLGFSKVLPYLQRKGSKCSQLNSQFSK